jgi:hypothetical protein
VQTQTVKRKSGLYIERRQASITAADPKVVLDAVIHALESPKPKTRYLMGGGAGQRKFLSMLPDRLRDRALLKAFGF